VQKDEFIKLSKKYSENKCSWGEKRAVEEFFKKLQDNGQVIPYNFSDEKRYSLLKRINSKIDKPKNRLFHLYSRTLKIAAIAITLLGIAFLANYIIIPGTITQVAAKGEKKTILLPDGSLVFLNSNSRISYSKNFKNKRELELTGEAFFEVKKNPKKPFLVETEKIKTKVLGTSFNIKAYKKGQTRVSVNTGKVEVELKEISEKIILIKNQQINFINDTEPLLTKDNSEDFIAWTKNTIVLKNTSLGEAANILENWYDIEINFTDKDLREQKISGKFKDEKLINILESISIVKQLEIEFLTEKQILIREKQQE
jgi:ferric-dicitrate binding protein FerR (iron transport regulator)